MNFTQPILDNSYRVLPCYEGGYGMHTGYDHGISGLFVLLTIFFVIYLISVFAKQHKFHDVFTKDRSLAILNERYAQGEISIEDYHQRKEELMKK